jgi:hypothetical protein
MIIHGRCVVVTGKLETGVVRVGETLLVEGEDGLMPVIVESIEIWIGTGSERMTEIWPRERDFAIGLLGIPGNRKELVTGTILTSVTWDGMRCPDIRSTEDLWKALGSSGAADRYTKLLHGITIDGLTPFFQTAAQVVGRPELVAPLILEHDWRAGILGAALAALLGSPRLGAPLIESLQAGSWVAPQLAAAIAALPGAPPDLSPLRVLLAHANAVDDPKWIMSIYAALSMGKDPAASEFEKKAAFSTLWANGGASWFALAVRWRGVWGVAGPYFRTRIAGESLRSEVQGPKSIG